MSETRPQRYPDALPGALAERFVVEGELGRGGLGVVLRVRERAGGRVVALKLLHSLEPEHRRRFEREALVTAALRHPGIVCIHDAGEVDGRGFLVCELVDGSSLRAALPDLDRRARVVAVRDAARALGFAHRGGIVHRDVKLENLLVDRDRRILVADFGLALTCDLDRLTRSGAWLGTPVTMAPEQLRSAHAVGPPADVWALGVVLYELLTGHLPFVGHTLMEQVALIQRAAPVPPRRHDRTIPRGLEAIVLRCLSSPPSARYPDGDALAVDLDRFLEGGEVAARPRTRGLGALTLAVVALAIVGAAVLAALPRGAEDALALRYLERRSREVLEGQALLAEQAPLLDALRRQARTLGPVSPPAAPVRARLGALDGLARLAAGDRTGAAAALERLTSGGDALGPAGRALRGALAVEADGGDARAAEDLAGARAAGVNLIEVGAWWARARAAAGLASSADAERVLRALEAVAARRGRATPAERRAQSAALLHLGQIEEARAALGELTDPDLEWALRVAEAKRHLADDAPAAALALLERPEGARETAAEAELLAEARRRAGLLLRVLRDGRLDAEERERLLLLLHAVRRLDPGARVAPEDLRLLIEHIMPIRTEPSDRGRAARLLTDLAPDDAELHAQVAFLVSRSGAPVKAVLLRAVVRAVELAETPARREELALVLADTLYHLAHYAESVAVCEEILAASGNPGVRGEVLALRGRCHLALDQPAAGLADLDAARAAAPGRVDKDRLQRAVALRRLGRHAEAFVEARRCVARAVIVEPLGTANQDEAAAVVWELGRRLGELPAAEETLEVFLRSRREYGGWWVRLGWLQLVNGRPTAAAGSLRRAAVVLGQAQQEVLRRTGAALPELAEQLETPAARERLERWLDVLEQLRGGGVLP